MASGDFTPRQRENGRNNYFVYQLFNVIAFTLLSGNILTLYSLRLGADSFFVGLLSAVTNIGFLLMLVGRQTIRRVGARRQWGISWLLRNLSMIPALFAPIASAAGNPTAALLLVFFSLVGFHFFKGIGLVSLDPILGALSEGRDRGAYLARMQISMHALLIITNLFMAVFLGPEANMSRYVILMGAGIAIGLSSTFFIFRLPDPVIDTSGRENTLFAAIKRGLKRPEFTFFVALAALVALITGLANPFIVVYAKRIYALPDNLVVLFLVVGNISAVSMGLLAHRLMDRLGAKALYLIFLGILCLATMLIIASPGLGRVGSLIFLGVLFFFYNFGLAGGMNSAQNYFYTITNVNERLNLGLLNYVLSGSAGALGSLVGGVLLRTLETTSLTSLNAFRIYYAVVLALLFGCFPLLIKLKNDGWFSVRTALEIFLSRRNLRAVALLHKLDTSRTAGEEVKIIDSLAGSHSRVAVNDILNKLTSPRFYVRSRALAALETLPLTDEVANALITQVKRHTYTTAHIAARIMGRKRIDKGLRVLRQSLSSEDYLLQAEATLALARLGDNQSIPKMEAILGSSRIPLVQIYAAAALTILRSISSLPHLFNALKRKNAPPYLRDEIILSIADLLGMGDWFYELYSHFLKQSKTGIESIIDYIEDCGVAHETLDEISSILSRLQSGRSSFSRQVAERLAKKHADDGQIIPQLIAVAKDGALMRLDRLAFLMAAILARLECRQFDIR